MKRLDLPYRSLRHGLLAVLVLAPLASAVAQPQPQRRGLPAPTRSVFSSDSVELPMRSLNGLPAVDAMIDGQGPYRLIVDTGAAGVVLRSDIAEQLELKSPPGMPPGAIKVQLASPGNAAIPATLVHIDKLTMGGATFEGVWTVATDLPFGDELHGVIGMNVFHECLLTYDYPGEKMRLHQGALPEPNGRDVLTYTTPGDSGSHPAIQLELGGEPAEFMIDTGMRGWFSLPHAQAERLGYEVGPVAGPRALFVGGSARRELARLRTPIRIGQYTVEHPIAFLAEEGGDPARARNMVLGTMLLRNFVVTFDAKNDRMQLARASTAAITPPALRALGISLRGHGKNMEVWDVHPASHAATVGIGEGDLVEELNGKPAAEIYGTAAWFDLLQSSETVTVRYTPKGEKPRAVELEVQELLPAAR